MQAGYIVGHGCSVYLHRFAYHVWGCIIVFKVSAKDDKQSKLFVWHLQNGLYVY